MVGRKCQEFQTSTFLSYLLHFFMQQMLLCISYCILNHCDNQESIHLFVRERSMNTHTEISSHAEAYNYASFKYLG